jgi:catechol 2,3-dioxygenase-like lactoylglutathione lyase family enzyme
VSDGSSRTPVGRQRRRRVRTVDIVGFDHVQLSMPRGEEALARLFYGGVLGLQEVRKPRQLARRGGAWFVGPGLAVHLGTEDPFRPARKAHVAFRVASLERARHRLEVHDVEVVEDDSGLPVRRWYIADPFGNRIELVDARDAGFSER